MAYIANDLSPVGSQARRGVSPQQFSYSTPDDLATVKGAGYFTQGPTAPVGNNALGLFSTSDWIHVVSDADTTPVFTIIFIDNDGSNGSDITTILVDISAA